MKIGMGLMEVMHDSLMACLLTYHYILPLLLHWPTGSRCCSIMVATLILHDTLRVDWSICVRMFGIARVWGVICIGKSGLAAVAISSVQTGPLIMFYFTRGIEAS